MVEILRELAKKLNLPSSILVERLIIEEARKQDLIEPDDHSPDIALHELLLWIEEQYEAKLVQAHEDFTLKVFERIQDYAEGYELWNHAIVPRAGQHASRRRQWVNARIGRFCKYLIGWDSKAQVVLPRNTDMLIKGYTKLKPRAA